MILVHLCNITTGNAASCPPAVLFTYFIPREAMFLGRYMKGVPLQKKSSTKELGTSGRSLPIQQFIESFPPGIQGSKVISYSLGFF